MPNNIPQNAEEPMACLILMPRAVKNGTINPPPPIPAALDAIPIKIPPITEERGVSDFVVT